MTSWEGQVGNGETVVAHASTRDQGRRVWDGARGQATPSLVGGEESAVLYLRYTCKGKTVRWLFKNETRTG